MNRAEHENVTRIAATGKGATELAIPWRALEALGLDRETLHVSANPIAFFGRKANDVTRNFSHTSFVIKTVTHPPGPARYTVRLHFCELDGTASRKISRSRTGSDA